MTVALVLVAQLCTVAPAGGITASESRAAFNHAIAAGPGGVIATWLERRPVGDDRPFPPGGREETAVSRVFTATLEAGDSELAMDGHGHAFVLWQELPTGAPAELRLAAVGCPR